MNFLVDAQLSRRMAAWLAVAGCDARHTLDLPDGNRTTDEQVNDVADREQRVVVTKDCANTFINSELGERASGMASWRRKFLALFPELRSEAQRPGFNPYSAFFRLLPRVREAHQDGDSESLRRIYGFAEWCLEQKAKELWNPAAVAFYEHLFDSHRSLWPDFVRWLSPRVVADCMGLWEWRLKDEELAEVRRLLADCRKPLYPDARFTRPRA